MTHRPFAIALLAAIVASACGPSPSAVAAAEVRSGAARASADAAAAKDVAPALDAFTADLYRAVAGQPGNLILSPYSVAVALAMTRAGAAGQTRKEMDAVLHAALARDLDAGFNALDQELAKRPGRYPLGDQTLDLELATANRLWGQKDLVFEAAFLDRLASHYGAGMQVVDYKKAREDARRAINDWVAARTKDRIKDLIPAGVLDPMTRLVLTNAIYLKANWANKFTEATPGTFFRADGSQVQAKLMRLSEQLRYGKGDGFQAVELPYVGGLSMVVLAPDTGRSATFEKAVDGAALRRAIDTLRPAGVTLWLPKFSFRSQIGMAPALSRLGMPTAFTDRADFSGMTRQDSLQISAVLHQAFIAVDENGTEAAAATGVVMRATSAPAERVELRVDRPFLFVITDKATGAILFMGRVADPTS